MFTVDQIKTAHSKVKSGADFPAYIQEIKLLGVTQYECYAQDGHIDYHGANNYTATVPPKYETLNIAEKANVDQFKADLKAHQEGKTDYLTFINMCATFGVEKWQVNIGKMTCIYFDKSGNEILVEQIPNK